MKTSMIVFSVALAALATASVALAQVPTPAEPSPPGFPPPERFAQDIAKFADLDAAMPPPSCSYLFVGSSSIRLWASLSEDLAPYPTLNRGFGGAHVSDVDYFFDKVVAPYQARAIFFYAGDNDLWDGKSPDQVLADFKVFLDLKTQTAGQTPVYFIAIKPSKQRFAQLALQDQVNQAVRALSKTRKDLRFVDIVPLMLEAGLPKDIYLADGLHMTPEGYALWTRAVRSMVEADAKEKRACGPELPTKKPSSLGWPWRKKPS